MDSSGERFVEIAIEGPLRGTFHYAWGTPLGDIPPAGARVVVPFARFRKTGYVLREVPEAEARAAAGGRELREVAYVLDRASLVTPGVLALARWVARHYLAGLGEVLSAVLPAGVRSKRRAARVKVVTAAMTSEELLAEAERVAKRAKKVSRALRVLAERREVVAKELSGGKADAALVSRLVKGGFATVREELRAPPASRPAATKGESPAFTLTRDQIRALELCRRMREGAADGGPAGLVLEGVTGSGKTEVYLRAIAAEVAAGRQAIVLVPEIALTPQTIQRFGERFDRLAILHSHLTEGARADEWRRVKRGEVDVVIGARSALFAPVPALGLIVVDEEHETSYKQDSSPRYHARETALQRARIEGASVILGSATPSLESYHAARTGELLHALLPERVGSRPLPPVEVVDMRAERESVKGYPILSGRFVRLLKETVSRGEQAIIFLNRRGYATFLRCATCSEDIRCEKCDVPLVFHKSARTKKKKSGDEAPAAPQSGSRAPDALRCHYCGATRPYPEMCPECGGGKLLALGTGTERVVDEIRRAVDCRIARMDADAMSKQEDYERVLADFREGRVDCLVGTQMIAKGLDLPRVTFVGVVNADVALHLADFRASERAFQLIAQVAGRTGRSDLGGRVVVQTELPESLPVRTGARHDMQAFAGEELAHRREFAYPPFTRLARIVVEGPREEAVEKKIFAIADALAPLMGGAGARYSLLGPAEAPLGKLKGKRRQHLIVKAADSEVLEELLWGADRALRSSGKTRVIVDVDPVNMR